MADRPLPEWGKLNSGQRFHVVAADIDRALCFAMLTGFEVALMQQVRERCWGRAVRFKGKGDPWPDAKPCVLNLSLLADETGIPRQRLSGAKANLIKSGILFEKGRSLSINKSAHEWIFPGTGEPRLTDKVLDFCASVRPKVQGELHLQTDPERDSISSKGELLTERNSVHVDAQLPNGIPFTNRTEFRSPTERNSVHCTSGLEGVPPRTPVEDPARDARPEFRSSEDLETRGEGNPPEISLSGNPENGVPKYDPDPVIARKQRAYDELVASMNANGRKK